MSDPLTQTDQNQTDKGICPRCGLAFARSAARTTYCSQACYLATVRREAADGLIARFWAKVENDGPIMRHELGPCAVWTAGLIRGYGQFHLPREGGKQHTVYAHRFAWALEHGPIPDNLSVLHKCDNPPCVRTDHLFLGTDGDNLTDARRKGRLIDGRHLIKVDDAGLLDIRTNYRPHVNGKALAAKYDISLVHLLRLARGEGRVRRRPIVFEPAPYRHLQIRGEVG